MIKHIVMYRLKDKNDCEKLRDTFLSMRGKIEELIEINAGIDVLSSERSFDVVLECVFENLESMARYKEHPVHLPVMKFVREIVVASHSVDYEF